MIRCILSSRNLDCGQSYFDAQEKARASWTKVAKEIKYFENESTNEPPTVKSLLDYAKNSFGGNDVVAIVNSDIVLTPDFLKLEKVANSKNLGMKWAATSFRYEGEPPEVKGQGLDVFVMTVPLIDHILKDIPGFMTLGRGMWDNWMNGWLRANLRGSHYYDMTPWRAVYHPEHERIPNRLSNYTDAQVKTILSSGNLDHRGIPSTKYL